MDWFLHVISLVGQSSIMTPAQWPFVAKYIQFGIHLCLELETTNIWNIVKDVAFLHKCNEAFTSEKTTHSSSLEKSYRKSRWLYSRWGGGGECAVLIFNKSKILRLLYLMGKLVMFNPFNALIFFPGVSRETSHMEIKDYGSTESIAVLHHIWHYTQSQSIPKACALPLFPNQHIM